MKPSDEDLRDINLLPLMLGGPLTPLHLSWVDEFNSEKRIIALKGPSLSGRSSIGLALIAIHTVLEDDQKVLIICENKTKLNAINKQLKQFISTLFEFMSSYGATLSYDRMMVNEIRLDNRSAIYMGLAQQNVLMGRRLNKIFLDLNVNSTNDIDHGLSSCIYPCLTFNGKSKILISTNEI